ncbi:adenosylcobinamide-phosphate synthase CbiB [Methylocaldum szegediense]|uniref:adenosylcobinamide-phosphate synthase CbiB n=1 Tax=Methylocaldum szegediense TaxID=73780 RepID=UPI0004094D7B|nr:adenosylcobinamide-phosphate synthase CbiB [Methylocaldum szegediense]
MSAILAVTAVLLDNLFGEPRRFHPLVGFGRLANALETRWNSPQTQQGARVRIKGVLAVLLLTAPPTALAACLASTSTFGPAFAILALYAALGLRSLGEHAQAVQDALAVDDLVEARRRVGHMVSRDTDDMNAGDVARAAVESVLENGNDAVFGTLFWFMVAGAPGAVLYRLANTLDAMWGYKSERFFHFGWAAARLDDVLNYVPARLTALTYVVLGNARTAWSCWCSQAGGWESPNAGPVMAAGAGALRLSLGGPACYRSEWHARPVLGLGPQPGGEDIPRAMALVRRGVWLWLAFWFAGGVLDA